MHIQEIKTRQHPLIFHRRRPITT